jgi:hypothetical protein
MGLKKCTSCIQSWNRFTILLFAGFVFTIICNQLLLAQERTINPRTLDVINRDQLQLNVLQQDTSHLELLNNVEFRNLQLQPRQKTVVNLERDISRVDAGTITQVNPEILARFNSQEIFSFPELHVENRGAADDGSGNIIYQPVITSLSPLVYNHISDLFTSTLNFLLLSQDESEGDISSPMHLELHSDYIDGIDPDRLQIGHLNLPSTSVNISARGVRDSVQIRIVTEANAEGYEAYLKVEPALNLFTERKHLQGLGIQQIPIQVNWKGSSSTESRVVNISSSQGTVTPTSVELSYNQPAIVYLRSEGLGNASLTATSTDAQSNTLQINFIFPWLFLLFSVAGGFLGGTAKYFTLKEKPKSFLATTAGSLSIGLIGALAYFVLGINLLNIEFSSTFNEFAVFGISALIAFLGIRKLKPDATDSQA